MVGQGSKVVATNGSGRLPGGCHVEWAWAKQNSWIRVTPETVTLFCSDTRVRAIQQIELKDQGTRKED